MILRNRGECDIMTSFMHALSTPRVKSSSAARSTGESEVQQPVRGLHRTQMRHSQLHRALLPHGAGRTLKTRPRPRVRAAAGAFAPRTRAQARAHRIAPLSPQLCFRGTRIELQAFIILLPRCSGAVSCLSADSGYACPDSVYILRAEIETESGILGLNLL